MGCWDEFCVICGGSPCAPDEDSLIGSERGEAMEPLNMQDFQWLDKFVGISETEELVPLGAYSGYGSFPLLDSDTEDFVGFKHPVSDPPSQRGIFCHERCFRLLQRDLGYTLRFQDVAPLLGECGGDDDFWISHLEGYTDYGGMEAYHDQYFDFYLVFTDGKEWMLKDPMECGENAERILAVWRPFLQSGFKVARRSPAVMVQPEGVGSQGLGSQGLGSQGLGSQGLESQGLGSQGLGSQGLGSQGLESQGLESQALGSQG